MNFPQLAQLAFTWCPPFGKDTCWVLIFLLLQAGQGVSIKAMSLSFRIPLVQGFFYEFAYGLGLFGSHPQGINNRLLPPVDSSGPYEYGLTEIFLFVINRSTLFHSFPFCPRLPPGAFFKSSLQVLNLHWSLCEVLHLSRAILESPNI